MSRAYVVYILTFAFLTAGLWVVFTLSGAMRAPDDLAGEWEVAWDNDLPPDSGEAIMHVDQSGRFFVIRFGHAKPISLLLAKHWRGARNGRSLQMLLTGGDWKVEITGDIPLRATRHIPEVRVTMTGPSNHSGVAHRREPQLTQVPHAPGIANAR